MDDKHAGWEPIDNGNDRYWAVFLLEGYSLHPDAIFRSREEAEAWLEVLRDDPDGPSCSDASVLAVRALSAEVWNSFDDIDYSAPAVTP